ncbi:MAG: FeoC-like transcriptional regulator [Gammaproteobacteria bacterium]
MLTLTNIKQLLTQKNQISLAELAKTYQEDPLVIQQMLYHFIKKGSVIEKRLTKHCGTACQQCPLNETVIYQWQSSQ